jgi:hypothetical protein
MRKILPGVLVVMIGLVVGCDPEQYVVWAPNGSKAAVIGTDGLHLCDANGTLTPLLVKDVRKVAWFGDSSRLAAAREVNVSNWTEAGKYLEAERIKRLEGEAEKLFKELMAQTGPLDQWAEALLDSPQGPEAGDLMAMLLYMGEKHGEALEKKIGAEEWKKLNKEEGVSLMVVQIYEITGEAKPGPMLASTFMGVSDLRPSPGGKVLAYTTGSKVACSLFVVPADGGAEPTHVADRCSRFADWSFDGRYLAYARVNPDGKLGDELYLGTLRRMQVCEGDGTLMAQVPVDKVKQPDGGVPAAEALAEITCDPYTRVRCLRDGRIIFTSVEVNLPAASDDVSKRLTLFAINPGRQGTVSRVLSRKAEADAGDAMRFFEINPDQTLVALPAMDGRITVAPLGGGAVTEVQASVDQKFRMVPSWRSSDELCYAVSVKAAEQKGRAAEVYLWRPGQNARMISKDWPREVMAIFERK